jgi:hypothetical protein
VADLGVALEQLGGEHDLVAKGGALEVLLGGEGKPAPILQADARPAPQT